jgi:hypothetical protein
LVLKLLLRESGDRFAVSILNDNPVVDGRFRRAAANQFLGELLEIVAGYPAVKRENTVAHVAADLTDLLMRAQVQPLSGLLHELTSAPIENGSSGLRVTTILRSRHLNTCVLNGWTQLI